MILSKFRIFLFATAFGLLSGGAVFAQSNGTSSEQTIDGRALYNENCAICHGPNGDGGGSLASQFSPRPRDFTKGTFRFRSTGIGESPAATDLLRTITNGVEGSYGRSMPSFAHLGFDEQIGLLGVILEFSGIDTFGKSIVVPARPDTANARAGERLFFQNGCVDCHGERGDGQGVLADGLLDEDGSQIRPANLRAGVFKGGNEPEDIWMRLQTGIDGTPMPSFGRNLTLHESWSIVDYVLELSAGD